MVAVHGSLPLSILTLLTLAASLAGCLEPSVDRADEQIVLTFQRDEQDDRLLVVAAEAGFAWEWIGVQANVTGTRMQAGGAEEPAVWVDVEEEFRHPSMAPGQVYAGDFLDFCAIEVPVGPVVYRVADMNTNTLLFAGTFDVIALCE